MGRPIESNTEQVWFLGGFLGGFVVCFVWCFIFLHKGKESATIYSFCTILYKFPLLFTVSFNIMLKWLMVSDCHYKLESRNNKTALENNL